MAAKSNEKPTTAPKAATAASAALPEVQTGEGNEGSHQNEPGPDAGGSGGLTQADLDKAVADAVDALKTSHAAELDKVREEGRAGLDTQLAKARKEGFDAGKEEALEELADQQQTSEAASSDDGYDDQQTLMARAILLGIVLRLPEVYRVAGEGPKLDELVAFIDSFESSADRYMAVELMKVLSETKASALASNAYQSTIRNGLKLVHGENAPDVLTEADSQDAAANRLDQAMKGRPNDIPPEALPREANLGAEHQVVTAEQQKAADRMARATGKH